MKRFLKATAFLLALTIAFPAAAFDFLVGDLYYKINSDGKTVTVEKWYNPSVVFLPNYVNRSHLDIPSSVTYSNKTYKVTAIGNGAFSGSFMEGDLYCYHTLTNVNIPNTITSIGDEAFYGCLGISSIVIPKSVKSIGKRCFACCDLSSISVDANNENYDSRDGCNAIIETKTNALVVGCTKTIIPNSVTSISHSAFYQCVYLATINIPSSVRTIGDYAFYECENLYQVGLPQYATIIGKYAFSGCYQLANVTLPNTLLTIEEYAFSKCNLFGITIPNFVNSIGQGVFFDCDCLCSATIGRFVTTIGPSAFSGCSALTSVTNLAEKPQVINANVFGGVDKGKCKLYVHQESIDKYKAANVWKDFIIDSHKLNYTTNGDNAITVTGYEGVMPSTLIIPASIEGLPVTSIGESAFEGCTILTSVTIPNSVTSIGNKAFRKCSNLKTANIPSSVTSIGSAAFSNCTALTTVSIPDKVTKINNSTFYNCNSLTYITIPSSVTSIGDSAFELCSSLTSATIPNSVKTLGRYAFYKPKSVIRISRCSMAVRNPSVFPILKGRIVESSATWPSTGCAYPSFSPDKPAWR